MLTEVVSPRPIVNRKRYNGPKPDFFIVGAPRSGTTAMFHYLSTHPEIWMSDRKETHFFGSDLNFGPQCIRRDRKAYLADYEGRNRPLRAGGASDCYVV